MKVTDALGGEETVKIVATLAEGEDIPSVFEVVMFTAKNIATPLVTRIAITANAPNKSLNLFRGAEELILRMR